MGVWLFLAHYFLAAKITIVIVVTVVRFVIVMVIFLVAVYKVVFNNFVAEDNNVVIVNRCSKALA